MQDSRNLHLPHTPCPFQLCLCHILTAPTCLRHVLTAPIVSTRHLCQSPHPRCVNVVFLPPSVRLRRILTTIGSFKPNSCRPAVFNTSLPIRLTRRVQQTVTLPLKSSQARYTRRLQTPRYPRCFLVSPSPVRLAHYPPPASTLRCFLSIAILPEAILRTKRRPSVALGRVCSACPRFFRLISSHFISSHSLSSRLV